MKNPFSRFISFKKRVDISLREVRSVGGDLKSQDWKNSLKPFDRNSGIASEAFKGSSRLVVMQFLTILFFVFFSYRLFDLKVNQGQALSAQADINYLRFNQIRANRGLIYDSQGINLAANEPSFSLAINLSQVADQEDLDSLLNAVIDLTDLDLNRIEARILAAQNAQIDRVALPVELEREKALPVLAQPDNYPGLAVEINPKRQYVGGESISHVLGYMTEVFDYELEVDEYYLAGDKKGREGLERQYETYLRGIKGRGVTEVDAEGRTINTRIDPGNDPLTGHDLVLTIDSQLQKAVYEAVQKG
ncbi:MAG TPA: hypothetical protein ENN77_00210, partial [Candidatus Wirthbacteria bacterium]|nr:hypothetical protein [Candidatus Wirthbacteria bacterium]